jgi:hypothetical protein
MPSFGSATVFSCAAPARWTRSNEPDLTDRARRGSAPRTWALRVLQVVRGMYRPRIHRGSCRTRVPRRQHALREPVLVLFLVQQLAPESAEPRTGHAVRIFNPRTDIWHEHFRWSRDSSHVMGRTAIGRATIQRLRLNRPPLVLARRIWARHGLHPAE